MLPSEWYINVANNAQESPHEHQQSMLLSRIITNVVCQTTLEPLPVIIRTHTAQEKLNEAVMVLNKSLQVC